jgi:NAD(P)-dependent dehydrogenase (short-subunit alcohol dehydrogenase family)
MPIRKLHDKKCLITGAASGIGRATAIAAAREGAVLFLTDVNAPKLQHTVSDIRDAGGKVALYKALDIASFEAVQGFAREIQADYGSLDVLMNVAGISIWGAVDTLEHGDWRRCVDINLMGPIHVIECFIPDMIKAGKGGHLVNVSSAAGLFGLPLHAAYSASKFGLRGVSEVLRFDLRRHGIGVSLVCPGGVNTGLVNTIEIRGVDPDDRRMLALKKLFQRHAKTPEQAAAAILRGMKRNRYMVFTSWDIWLGYWAQRLFSPPYELVMRLLNNRLQAVIGSRATGESSR